MNGKRTNAIITGWGLILMALTAGFAFGYAFPAFYDKNNPEAIQDLLINNIGLYKLMLAALMTVAILDILVSWTLYQFFKEDNRKISFVSLTLRLGYTLILGMAIFFLFANLKLGIDSNTVISNYSSFERIWSLGLIIFGFHLLALGILMKLHKPIPKWLWILTLFAGLSYSIIHILKYMLPNSPETIETLNIVLGLPMALGEICLAIWLIVKGGK